MKLLVLRLYTNIIFDEPEDSSEGCLQQVGIVGSIKKLKEVILKDMMETYESEFDHFVETYDPEDEDYENFHYDFENIYDKPQSYTKCYKQFFKEKRYFDLDTLNFDHVEKENKNELIRIIDYEDSSDEYFIQRSKYYIIKLS